MVTVAARLSSLPQSETSAQALLDALDGIAYLADRDGIITSVGRRNWRAFADENRGRNLLPGQVIGRPILDFVKGEPVRAAYRSVHEQVCTGRRPFVSFRYRCDAPDRERKMRMSISAVKERGRVVAVLYQSVVLSDVERPWMSLFDQQAVVAFLRQDDSLPLVQICCACHAVAEGGGTATTWISPEKYYELGRPSQIRVSHGLCAACTEQMLNDDAAA